MYGTSTHLCMYKTVSSLKMRKNRHMKNVNVHLYYIKIYKKLTLAHDFDTDVRDEATAGVNSLLLDPTFNSDGQCLVLESGI